MREKHIEDCLEAVLAQHGNKSKPTGYCVTSVKIAFTACHSASLVALVIEQPTGKKYKHSAQ